MVIVQKYGGSSVADAQKIFAAADEVGRRFAQGHDVVVVVSAQGGNTDLLLAKAREISENPHERELDALLATGEAQSAALMAMALWQRGLPAVSLDARQAGVLSTAEHGRAKIEHIEAGRILAELHERRIVIITGFQGVNELGDVTTLGRGASDTTAIALAAALNADICEIYTDVEGIFTADPRICSNARKHKEISYDEILELAAMGAKVLHGRSVEMASKYGVRFAVKSSAALEAEPTFIKAVKNMEGGSVSGITALRECCKISVGGVSEADVPLILGELGSAGIAVDVITYSALALELCITAEDGTRALNILKNGEREIRLNRGLCKLSIIGQGIVYNPTAISLIWRVLRDVGATVHLASLSGMKASILVDETVIDIAIGALHDEFEKSGMMGGI